MNIDQMAMAIYRRLVKDDPKPVAYDQIVTHLIVNGFQAEPQEWVVIREILFRMVEDGAIDLVKPATKTTYAEFAAL